MHRTELLKATFHLVWWLPGTKCIRVALVCYQGGPRHLRQQAVLPQAARLSDLHDSWLDFCAKLRSNGFQLR